MKNVLLYGDSILLTGLAIQLQGLVDVRVRQQSPRKGALNLEGVEAVIVDFNEVHPADMLDILRARPDLKVVGVNITGSAVTVLSGRGYLAHKLKDVMEFLE